MFNKRYFFLTVFIFITGTALAVSPVPDTQASGNEQPDSLAVTRVELPLLRYLDATVEAEYQATVSAQVSGRIIELPFDVDDYVQKGEVIARFRDKDQRAAVKSAQASVDEAQLAFNRTRDIYNKKLIARAELDRVEARLKTTKANLEQAKEALENTVVRAPYSGILVKRHVEPGELARVGQKLVTGLSLEKLRATVQVPQSMIHALRENKQAWVWVGKKLENKIEVEKITISPYADPVTHTFTTRLYLPQGDHQVYPGMHTRVAFKVAAEQQLIIPQQAVVHRSEVTAVYVRQKDAITMRQIRTGRKLDGNMIEVLSGLTEGELVMRDPTQATYQLKQPQK